MLVVLRLFYCCLLSGTHKNRSVTAASEMLQWSWLGAKTWQICVGCLSPKFSFIASGSLQCLWSLLHSSELMKCQPPTCKYWSFETRFKLPERLLLYHLHRSSLTNDNIFVATEIKSCIQTVCKPQAHSFLPSDMLLKCLRSYSPPTLDATYFS